MNIKKIYLLNVEFYGVPQYKPGDEIPFVNYQDHRLKILVGNKMCTNQTLVVPKLSKEYR